MTRFSCKILFYVKKTKLLKNGNAPLFIRISSFPDMVEISLKRNIKPELWDSAKSKAKGNSDEAKELNEFINNIRVQLFQIQQDILASGKKITVKTLANTFLGVGEKNWTLAELFEEHNSNLSQLIDKEFSPLTLQRYNTSLQHIKKFMLSKYNNANMLITEVDNKFITNFEFYLKTVVKCQHNSVMKHIKSLKKITRIAIANGYIKVDPFLNYRITNKIVERECLTQLELNKIIEKNITIPRLDLIRDLFVFQCYTGLAYSDLASLTQDNIEIGIDGNRWIVASRTKTGIRFRIPLFQISENIIKKYTNHTELQITGKLFPVPSNQKMNAYLKEIATICGINKIIHTHLARHTYATTITLSNGIPIETVSKLLGHRKINTTQIYAKVIDKKVNEDVELLREKLL
jgi:site-specific recombinase XerD